MFLRLSALKINLAVDQTPENRHLSYHRELLRNCPRTGSTIRCSGANSSEASHVQEVVLERMGLQQRYVETSNCVLSLLVFALEL